MARCAGARGPPGLAVRGCAAQRAVWPLGLALAAAAALPSVCFVGRGTARASPPLSGRRVRPVEIVPSRPGGPCIVVVSDSTGETAKQLFSRVLEASPAGPRPGVTLYGYVTKPMELAEILTAESSKGYSQVFVVATLVEPSMMRWIEKLSVDLGIEYLNLMKPMLDEFNTFLGSQARGQAGAVDAGKCIVMQQLDDMVSKEFLGMIEAANYVRSRSDSRRPEDWQEADIVLVGVSRCGKTSVASFLAQRGKKVACVRIAANKPIPEGLELADPSKVVLITKSAEQILTFREKRVALTRSKVASKSLTFNLESYATPDRVRQDLEVFEQLSGRHPEWIGPLDCTYLCEDETSSQILGMKRDQEKRTQSPSAPAAPALDSQPSPLLLAMVPVALAFGVFLGQAGKALGEGRAAAPRPPWGSRGGSVLAGVRNASGRPLRALCSRVTAQRGVLEDRLEKEANMRNEIRIMADAAGESGAGKCVYLVADDAGEIAQLLLSRLLVQYSDLEQPSVRLFAELDSVPKVRQVVEQAKGSQQDVFVLATLLQPGLSEALEELGEELGVRTYNVMAGLQRIVAQMRSSDAMDQLIFDGSSDGISLAGSASSDGPVRKMPTVNSAFFRMAEAVQFAQQHISGVNSQEWPEADVLLVGPSRVGKETLAYYLAQRGVKAACFTPSSGGKALPALSSLDPSKVVFLTMSVDFLKKRREYRVQELKRKGVPVFFEPGYTNQECIELELDSLVQLARTQQDWMSPIDITDYDIPEACDVVLTALREASIQN